MGAGDTYELAQKYRKARGKQAEYYNGKIFATYFRCEQELNVTVLNRVNNQMRDNNSYRR